MSRKDFQYVRACATRCAGKFIAVQLRPSSSSVTRVGICVSKKYGKAHERNRFKRMVREAFRLNYHRLPPGLSLIVYPRFKAKRARAEEIAHELISLLSPSSNAND